jgi:hypothetical protein
MDLANLRTIPPATKYRIKLLSTTYVDSDAMPVDSFPKFNAARVNSAQGQSPVMVGYIHDSKTLWRIWDPEFQRVKAQTEVIFDKERNTHMSCQHESNEIDTDIFGLPEDKEHIEE